jgi:hypothetical protein
VPEALIICFCATHLSHIPKHAATTVRIAMIEGSRVSPMVPAEAGTAIPNAQSAIPNIQISSRFILLTSAAGQSREILNPPLRERSLPAGTR